MTLTAYNSTTTGNHTYNYPSNMDTHKALYDSLDIAILQRHIRDLHEELDLYRETLEYLINIVEKDHKYVVD